MTNKFFPSNGCVTLGSGRVASHRYPEQAPHHGSESWFSAGPAGAKSPGTPSARQQSTCLKVRRIRDPEEGASPGHPAANTGGGGAFPHADHRRTLQRASLQGDGREVSAPPSASRWASWTLRVVSILGESNSPCGIHSGGDDPPAARIGEAGASQKEERPAARTGVAGARCGWR